MKFNWGHGIALSLILFVVFIVGLSIRLMRADSSVEHLDYYRKGLAHDEQMAMDARSIKYRDSVHVYLADAGNLLIVHLPAGAFSEISGMEVHMYRASDASLDRKIEVKKPETNPVRVRITPLLGGKWEARVHWTMGGQVYYIEQVFFVDS